MRNRDLLFAGAILLAGAHVSGAQAQSGGGTRPSGLFVSPMGEPFRANATGARGIDLWFTASDANYDTRISHDEFIANANAFFPHVDASQDGALTSLEDTAYWRRTAPELVDGPAGGQPIGNTLGPPEQRQRQGGYEVVRGGDVNIRGPNRGRPAERLTGAQGYGLLDDAEPIMSCDSNFDRRVTLAEFGACAERRFALLDANHDGFITPDETSRNENAGDVVRVPR